MVAEGSVNLPLNPRSHSPASEYEIRRSMLLMSFYMPGRGLKKAWCYLQADLERVNLKSIDDTAFL